MTPERFRNIFATLMSSELRLEDLVGAGIVRPGEAKWLRNSVAKDGHRILDPSLLELAYVGLAAGNLSDGITVVAIGANDGVSGDPLYKLNLQLANRLLLVEPQPELIGNLREAYRGFRGDIAFENAAASSSSGWITLYRLKQAYVADYVQRVGRHPWEISSVSHRFVLRKLQERLSLKKEDVADCIEALKVRACRAEDLIVARGFERVDILQVDCEGHDWEVIKGLGVIKPTIINFESFNLSGDEWRAWVAWAEDAGYGYVEGRMDCLAIKDWNRMTAFRER